MSLNVTIREATTSDIVNSAQRGSKSKTKKKEVKSLSDVDDLFHRLEKSEKSSEKMDEKKKKSDYSKITDTSQKVEGEKILSACQIPRIGRHVSSKKLKSFADVGVEGGDSLTVIVQSDIVGEAKKGIHQQETVFKVLTHDVLQSSQTQKISIVFTEELKYRDQFEFFEIQPKIEGEMYWLGNRTFIFSPHGRFPKSHEFKCAVKKGVLSKSGKRFSKDYEFSFCTPRIRVYKFIPGNQEVCGSAPLFLRFSQEIEHAKILDLLMLNSRLSVQRISLRILEEDEIEGRLDEIKKFSMNLYKKYMVEYEEREAEKSLWFCPVKDLALSTSFTLSFEGEIPSKEGMLLGNHSENYRFSTFPQFTLKGNSKEVLPLQRFRIWFNNIIDRNSFTPKMVDIVPRVEDLEIVPSEKSLFISGKTEGNTLYNVTIKKSLKDVFGMNLKKSKKVRIKVTRAAPTLQAFRDDLVVLDPTVPESTMFNLVVCNISTLRLTVFKVHPKEFPFCPLGRYSDPEWLKKKRGVSKKINVNIVPDNPVEVKIDLLPYLNGKEKIGQLYIVVKAGEIKSDRPVEEVTAWVQCTKLAFDSFSSHDGKLCLYGNSLENGNLLKPVGGKKFAKFTYFPYNLKKKKIEILANEYGLAVFDEKMIGSRRLDGLILLEYGKDSVFTTKVPEIYSVPSNKILSFIFDDRKLYKPKEEIHVKGFFRRLIREGPIYKIKKFETTEIKYTVSDGRHDEFLKGDDVVKDGAVKISFKIPEKPNLGTFRIVFIFSKELSFTHTFKCQMFRTPQFFVQCKTDQSNYIVRDDFVMKSVAAYYSGGPLSDSEVQWVVEQKNSFYRPPNNIAYNFRCAIESYTENLSAAVRFKGTSNIDGEHSSCFSTAISPLISEEERYYPVSLSITSHVKDLNKQTISGSKKVTIHPCGLYIGSKSNSVYEELSKPVSFDVVITNLDGVPQNNIPFSVFVKRMESVNLWTTEYRLKKAYQFRSTTPFKNIEIPFPEDGSHMLIFKVFDGNNRSHACSQIIHIFDPKNKYSSRGGSGGFDLGRNLSKKEVVILADKKKYNYGELCRLLIDAPLTPPMTCYIHIYADGIVKKEIIEMKSKTQIYEIEMIKEYVPNITIQAYVVGREVKNEKFVEPAYASNKIDLDITTDHAELSVVVNPQQEVIKPGSNSKVNIKIFPKLQSDITEDFDGALATIIVVDEAILNLVNYRIKNPLSRFFPRHITSSVDKSTRSDVFIKKWTDIELKAPRPPTVVDMGRNRNHSQLPIVKVEITEKPFERARAVFKVAPDVDNKNHWRPIPVPREILTLQLGQAGNQIGESFWESMIQEHDIDADGNFGKNLRLHNEGMGIYFREHPNTRYRNKKKAGFYPRSLLVDTDPSVVDGILSRRLRNLFNPSNRITSNLGSGNNWAKGHYSIGAEMEGECMDAIRKEIEMMESFQGFHMLHSIGGGTGGGFGSLLLSKAREEFPDRMMSTMTVLPSTRLMSSTVEAYNATLSVHHLVENADMCFLYGNDCLYQTVNRLLGKKKISTLTINQIISNTVSDITSSFRYPGYLNADLRKMSVNLIPFPRLHFLGVQTSPIDGYAQYTYPNVEEVTYNLFQPSHNLSNFSIKHGRYTTAYAIYRGGGTPSVIEQSLMDVQNKNSSYFVEWIPHNCSVSMVPYTRDNKGQVSALCISNHTAVQEPFKTISERFTALFRRKAFLHWYTTEGMDEMEFTEAESNMNDLISEYQQYQDATADEDGEFEYGEGEGEEDFEEEEELLETRKKCKKPKSETKKKVPEEKEKKEIKLRKDFRPLACYVDQVRSDSCGVMEVPIPYPDNLTRFRISVVANRGEYQFGYGEAVVRTNLPFTIKPSPPRFCNLSDIFICPVVVQNQYSKAVDIRLGVKSSENLLISQSGYLVEKLGPKERCVIHVEVRVEKLGDGEGLLKFVGEAKAVGDNKSFVDAVEKRIPIEVPHTIEFFSVQGVMEKSCNRILQPIELDGDISLIPTETRLSIDISSSAVSSLAKSYGYLHDYKFLCVEQTSSGILSSISLLDIRDRFFFPPKTEESDKKKKKKRRRKKRRIDVLPSPEEIRENVKQGILRLGKYQGVQGGFGFWSRDSFHPTATLHAGFAILRILERNDPDLKIPPMMLKKLVDLLSNLSKYLKRDEYLGKRTSDELLAQSFFLLAIYHTSKNKKVKESVRIMGTEEIVKNVKKLLSKKERTYIMRSFCVLSLTNLGRKKHSEIIDKEVDDLLLYVEEHKNTAFVVEKFEESDYNRKLIALSSSTKTNAILLEVLMNSGLEKHDEITHKLARWLLNGSITSKNSRWANTHLCCYCCLALNKYFLKYEKGDGGISKYFIGFENQQVEVDLETPKKISHFAEIMLDENSSLVYQDEIEGESSDEDTEILKGKTQFAFIQRQGGSSRLYYTLSFRYAVGNLQTPSVDRGFSIRRTYHHVEGEDENSVKRDLVNNEWVIHNGCVVKVEIMMYTPSPRYHIAMVDFLPAGFEILNPEFSVIPKNNRNGKYNHIWYSHQNMRDDRIEVFSERLYGGVSNFVYFIRATSAGRYVIPPCYVEEMYDNEIYGRTSTSYAKIVNKDD